MSLPSPGNKAPETVWKADTGSWLLVGNGKRGRVSPSLREFTLLTFYSDSIIWAPSLPVSHTQHLHFVAALGKTRY